MYADIVDISASGGVRTITAICPHGREVRHGGGPTSAPLAGYLGRRTSHVPCCSVYTLRLPNPATKR